MRHKSHVQGSNKPKDEEQHANRDERAGIVRRLDRRELFRPMCHIALSALPKIAKTDGLSCTGNSLMPAPAHPESFHPQSPEEASTGRSCVTQLSDISYLGL